MMRKLLLYAAIAALSLAVRAQEEPATTKDEVFSLATLAESEKAWAACVEENSRRVMADAEAALRRGPRANLERMRLKELGLLKDEQPEEPEACKEATVAKLTAGTIVRVEPAADECGDRMRKVTVLSGKAKDKSGCILLFELTTIGEDARVQREKDLQALRDRASTKRRK